MNLTLTIPDAQKTRFIEALVRLSGYQAKIQDEKTGALIDNPLTKEQFIKQWLINSIKIQIKRSEIERAAQQTANDLEKTYQEIDIS